MTALCIKSLRYFYPNTGTIYILYDDQSAHTWPDYQRDAQTYYQSLNLGTIHLYKYSDIHGEISNCDVGWWRQQLVKLSIDLLLPEDEWLVIDGDVIFDEHIDLHNVTPVHVRGNATDTMTIMVSRYVDTFLGHPNLRVQVQGQHAITSSIPFRWLDRQGLVGLRNQVEQTLHEDFFKAHTRRFRECEIVGYVPEGDKLVMHEWELWEAYNHLTRPNKYKIVETGSGYHTKCHTSACIPGHRFRHSSAQDAEISRSWIEEQSIEVSDELWNKVIEFSKKAGNA